MIRYDVSNSNGVYENTSWISMSMNYDRTFGRDAKL